MDDGDSRVSGYVPLIVNTMGWTKGLGADLARKIEESVEPTHIFELVSPTFEKSWSITLPAPAATEYPTMSQSTAKLHALQPIPPSVVSAAYSAADHRNLAILSYFHAVFPSGPRKELTQTTATMWDVALPLCARSPYEVEFASAIDKVVLAGAGSEDVHPDDIARVLNGAVVGLVSCEPGSLYKEDDGTAPSFIPYAQGSSVPSPLTSSCHGLALIRAVSPGASHMHLLSPLPPSLLAKSRVLVKGEVELPVWGMLDFRSESGDEIAGVEKGKVPYLQWGKGEGLGGEKKRVRRNLMRKGQN